MVPNHARYQLRYTRMINCLLFNSSTPPGKLR